MGRGTPTQTLRPALEEALARQISAEAIPSHKRAKIARLQLPPELGEKGDRGLLSFWQVS